MFVLAPMRACVKLKHIVQTIKNKHTHTHRHARARTYVRTSKDYSHTDICWCSNSRTTLPLKKERKEKKKSHYPVSPPPTRTADFTSGRRVDVEVEAVLTLIPQVWQETPKVLIASSTHVP